jgi:8-oxo-dGTP pyrophosphatase MutT (NUDIX family)
VRQGGDQVIPRPRNWRPGEAAPWAGAREQLADLDEILRRIAGRGAGAPPLAPLAGGRPSAVLVALFDAGAGPEVVLTRRARHLRNHHGEVSFPGGRIEPGETPVAAALREADEEVALDPALVTVIGELDHLATLASRSVIAPVVGRVGGRPELKADTGEVDRILTVPLAELLRSDTYHEEVWGSDIGERTIHFFELDDETVWGATARMLVQLLAIGTGVWP